MRTGGSSIASAPIPTEFVQALTEAGFLSVADPRGIRRRRAGHWARRRRSSRRSTARAATAPPATRRCTRWARILRHGSEAQKSRYLPKIASGELRLQAFGVTEPTSGTDTTRIRTFARRDGDKYIVNGQKIWISRAEHSDLMVLLVRTTPREEVREAAPTA